MPAFNPNIEDPKTLLKACPVYKPSPIQLINHSVNIRVFVKDETGRMNMGSFKALGGVYAVAKLIEQLWEKSAGQKLFPDDYQTPSVLKFASNITFVCASAGNHGLAVAAGARIFGANARIHLSSEVPNSFIERLRSEKADIVSSGTTYEESVKAATADADSTEAILLADGSWPGYIKPPSLVMEGYTVIAEELRESFEIHNNWPTHVFLQAGVGGLAGAITFMIRKNWKIQPIIIIVEPDAAPCLLESAKAGRPVQVSGPASSMGRLDCKEPSIIAYEILMKSDVEYITISDEEAAVAVDELAADGFTTTPSGAAGYAGLNKFNLPLDANPLIIISEGKV